ncbi:hypothetical protein HDU76_003080, partial [Blyttiomyces sp. JEL0837]
MARMPGLKTGVFSFILLGIFLGFWTLARPSLFSSTVVVFEGGPPAEVGLPVPVVFDADTTLTIYASDGIGSPPPDDDIGTLTKSLEDPFPVDFVENALAPGNKLTIEPHDLGNEQCPIDALTLVSRWPLVPMLTESTPSQPHSGPKITSAPIVESLESLLLPTRSAPTPPRTATGQTLATASATVVASPAPLIVDTKPQSDSGFKTSSMETSPTGSSSGFVFPSKTRVPLPRRVRTGTAVVKSLFSTPPPTSAATSTTTTTTATTGNPSDAPSSVLTERVLANTKVRVTTSSSVPTSKTMTVTATETVNTVFTSSALKTVTVSVTQTTTFTAMVTATTLPTTTLSVVSSKTVTFTATETVTTVVTSTAVKTVTVSVTQTTTLTALVTATSIPTQTQEVFTTGTSSSPLVQPTPMVIRGVPKAIKTAASGVMASFNLATNLAVCNATMASINSSPVCEIVPTIVRVFKTTASVPTMISPSTDKFVRWTVGGVSSSIDWMNEVSFANLSCPVVVTDLAMVQPSPMVIGEAPKNIKTAPSGVMASFDLKTDLAVCNATMASVDVLPVCEIVPAIVPALKTTASAPKMITPSTDKFVRWTVSGVSSGAMVHPAVKTFSYHGDNDVAVSNFIEDFKVPTGTTDSEVFSAVRLTVLNPGSQPTLASPPVLKVVDRPALSFVDHTDKRPEDVLMWPHALIAFLVLVIMVVNTLAVVPFDVQVLTAYFILALVTLTPVFKIYESRQSLHYFAIKRREAREGGLDFSALPVIPSREQIRNQRNVRAFTRIWRERSMSKDWKKIVIMTCSETLGAEFAPKEKVRVPSPLCTQLTPRGPVIYTNLMFSFVLDLTRLGVSADLELNMLLSQASVAMLLRIADGVPGGLWIIGKDISLILKLAAVCVPSIGPNGFQHNCLIPVAGTKNLQSLLLHQILETASEDNDDNPQAPVRPAKPKSKPGLTKLAQRLAFYGVDVRGISVFGTPWGLNGAVTLRSISHLESLSDSGSGVTVASGSSSTSSFLSGSVTWPSTLRIEAPASSPTPVIDGGDVS